MPTQIVFQQPASKYRVGRSLELSAILAVRWDKSRLVTAGSARLYTILRNSSVSVLCYGELWEHCCALLVVL